MFSFQSPRNLTEEEDNISLLFFPEGKIFWSPALRGNGFDFLLLGAVIGLPFASTAHVILSVRAGDFRGVLTKACNMEPRLCPMVPGFISFFSDMNILQYQVSSAMHLKNCGFGGFLFVCLSVFCCCFHFSCVFTQYIHYSSREVDSGYQICHSSRPSIHS